MGFLPPVPSPFARKYLVSMATAQMTSTITITRPTETAFNATTGDLTAGTAAAVWSGPGRIYSEAGSLTAIGGELVSLGQTFIAIPQSATLPHVDDLVTVTASSDDPALVDRVFRIVDVSMGGVISPTRKLTVTAIEPNPWNES